MINQAGPHFKDPLRYTFTSLSSQVTIADDGLGTVDLDVNEAAAYTWTGAHVWSAGSVGLNNTIPLNFGTSSNWSMQYTGTHLTLTPVTVNSSFQIISTVSATAAHNLFDLQQTNASSAAGTRRTQNVSYTVANTTTSAGQNNALNATCTWTGSGNLTNAIFGLNGGRYVSQVSGTGTGNVTQATGHEAQVQVGGASTGTVTNAVSLDLTPLVLGGNMNITNLYGIRYRDTPLDLGTGTITNAYGFFCAEMTQATNSYEFGTTLEGGIYFALDFSSSDFINSVGGGGNVSYHTEGSFGGHQFYVGASGGSLELSINANTMTFEAGASDPVLDWSTSGELYLSAGKFHTNGEVEIDGALNHDGTTVGFYGTAPATQSAAYSGITNVTTDRAYDANATTLDEIADVLGTLIADLRLTGIIG